MDLLLFDNTPPVVKAFTLPIFDLFAIVVRHKCNPRRVAFCKGSTWQELLEENYLLGGEAWRAICLEIVGLNVVELLSILFFIEFPLNYHFLRDCIRLVDIRQLLLFKVILSFFIISFVHIINIIVKVIDNALYELLPINLVPGLEAVCIIDFLHEVRLRPLVPWRGGRPSLWLPFTLLLFKGHFKLFIDMHTEVQGALPPHFSSFLHLLRLFEFRGIDLITE